MKLFLSGGSKRAFELDKEFIKHLDKTKPLLYIPIAMDESRHPYPECLNWMTNYFSSLKFDNFKMVTNLSKIKDLEKYSGVYVGGGNTPKLLHEMKQSGFWQLLKVAIDKDMPVAGGSAGAIIHAKTIIPSLSDDENNVGLTDFSAYNNLNGYDMWCHYGPSMDGEVKEYLQKYNLKKIIALPEYCGIYVKGNKMQILGEHSAWIFDKNGKREIKMGEKLK